MISYFAHPSDYAKKRITDICQLFINGPKKASGIFYSASLDIQRAEELILKVEGCKSFNDINNVVSNFIHLGKTDRDKTIATFSRMEEGTLRCKLITQICPKLWNTHDNKVASDVTVDLLGKITSHNKNEIAKLVDFTPKTEQVYKVGTVKK